MKKYFAFILFLIPLFLFSGETKIKKTSYEFKMEFMDGYVKPGPLFLSENIFSLQNTTGSKKSVFLAGMLSAVIPGAGEFYSESYIKGGLFLGVEVASWILNFRNNKEGDKQTTFFENYADQNWNVVKYAEWIKKNLYKFVPDQANRDKCLLLLDINPNSNLKPWERINFNNLNEVEHIIGGAFSHALPPHGDQQYYELIGKYPQFRQGWPDADPNDNESYKDKDSLSAIFKWYSIERGKANDYYSVAQTFISIIIVNHIVSALDAALSAYLYNKAHVSMTFQTLHDPSGKFTLNPTINLQLKF